MSQSREFLRMGTSSSWKKAESYREALREVEQERGGETVK